MLLIAPQMKFYLFPLYCGRNLRGRYLNIWTIDPRPEANSQYVNQQKIKLLYFFYNKINSFRKFFKQKGQLFTSSNFSIVIICCFSLYIIVNWRSLCFGLILRQNKQFEDGMASWALRNYNKPFLAIYLYFCTLFDYLRI